MILAAGTGQLGAFGAHLTLEAKVVDASRPRPWSSRAAMGADQHGVPLRAQLPWHSEMWHCPSCGAPQAESARCWVCHRSSTTCSTCTHFRRALAGDLGYCGRDAKRQPLTGRELRGCWEPKPEAAHLNVLSKVLDEAQRVRAARAPVPAYQPAAEPASRDFVPVEPIGEHLAAARGAVDPPLGEAPEPFVIEPEPAWAERTTLFGEPEG